MSPATPQLPVPSHAALALCEAQNGAELDLLLGIQPGTVSRLLSHRGSLYDHYRARKASGGIRLFSEPGAELKKVQQGLVILLNDLYRPPESVYGYVKNRDIVTQAKRHVGASYVLSADLNDFFGSIHVGRVAGALEKRLGFHSAGARLVARLCCERGSLPQGAPSSPILSNIVGLGMDEALDGLAAAWNCTNTRWADDLTFSSREGRFPKALFDRDRVRLGSKFEAVLEASGFAVNHTKTRFAGPRQAHIVLGIVTKPRLSVRQTYMRGVRGMLHAWERYGLAAAQRGLDQRMRRAKPRLFESVLRGRIDHIGHVRGRNDGRYTRFLGLWKQLAARDGLTSSPEL